VVILILPFSLTDYCGHGRFNLHVNILSFLSLDDKALTQAYHVKGLSLILIAFNPNFGPINESGTELALEVQFSSIC
jgi:hypothetical protein